MEVEVEEVLVAPGHLEAQAMLEERASPATLVVQAPEVEVEATMVTQAHPARPEVLAKPE